MKHFLPIFILAAALSACNSGPDSASTGSGDDLPRYDVSLSWTAVGDDGLSGRAAAYDLRYAADSITLTSDWQKATLVSPLPLPATAGDPESLMVSLPLEANETYYFAIKTRDEAGNWSPISNIHAFVAADSLLSPVQTSADH